MTLSKAITHFDLSHHINEQVQVVIDGYRQVTLDFDNQIELKAASFARIPPGASAVLFGNKSCRSIFLCTRKHDTKTWSKKWNTEHRHSSNMLVMDP